jgi:hypothetical protein
MPEPLIKICGLSTPEAVDAAVAARATHIGLVHYPPSPRHVSLERAAALRARVPRAVKVVLLLVNEQPQPTAQAIQAVRPDVVQFHGTETPEWLALLRQNTPLEIWKAIGVQETANLERAQRYKERGAPAALRRAGAEAARRHRPGVRLVAADQLQHTIRGASRRADPGNRGRGDPRDRGRAGRHLVGRRERARDQGRGQDRGLLPSRARIMTEQRQHLPRPARRTRAFRRFRRAATSPRR